jgi:hypothetical protein
MDLIARFVSSQGRVDRHDGSSEPPNGEHACHQFHLVWQHDRQYLAAAQSGARERGGDSVHGVGELLVGEFLALIGDAGSARAGTANVDPTRGGHRSRVGRPSHAAGYPSASKPKVP